MGCVPITLGWILITLATSVPTLYIARILCGLSLGLCISVMPIYLGEIASHRIRGSLLVMCSLMLQVGVLLAYSVAPFISFHALALFGLFPVAIFSLTAYWLPETPYYLIMKSEETLALACLKKLRGHDEVQDELQKIIYVVQNTNSCKVLSGWNAGDRYSVLIMVCIASLEMLCGSFTIIVYAETIFEKFGSNLKVYQLSILFGLVQVITSGLAASVVDLIGRKPLLKISVCGTAICNLTVGLFFLLERYSIETSSFAWIPILAIMAFIFFYFFGMASVVFVFLGEIFSNNMKKVGCAMYTMVSALMAFMVQKLFQVVSDNVGSDVPFFAFAIFGILFLPFVWFYVPETKRKYIHDILDDLNTGIK